MSSYEKQMQWKKATNVKAKKNHDEKSAEETYSFAPVFYTQGSSSTRSRDGNRNNQEETFSSSMKGKSNRSKEELLLQSNGRSSKSKPRTHSEDSLHNSAYAGEVGVHSPEGAVSVESAHGPHVHSDEGDGGGYSRSYAEHHRPQSYRSARPGSSNYRSDGIIDEAGEDDRSDPEGSHSHHSREQRARKVVSRNSAPDKNRDSEHRNGSTREERTGHKSSRHHSNSKGTHKHTSHRHGSSRRHRGASTGTGSGDRNHSHSSSSSSSSSGSSSNSEDDEAEEPIIELLERERKQWREEREKLIQCIHLQQLELSQRSIAAHDRAADIAKEFARAIECFEERLVSVEGTVQKEIMSIKTIAEALLHAATRA